MVSSTKRILIVCLHGAVSDRTLQFAVIALEFLAFTGSAMRYTKAML